MSKQFEARKLRLMSVLNSTDICTDRRQGKKKQRSRNVKLDRFQHNLTNAQSGKARQSWNYYPDEKQAYLA